MTMGLGLYDNHTGEYAECEWLTEGFWFVDEDGNLYIIPQKGVVAESEGPDTDLCDELGRLVEEHGEVPVDAWDRLGVAPVPEILKRFDPWWGYYNA